MHVFNINRLGNDKFCLVLKDSVIFRDCPTHFIKNVGQSTKLFEIDEKRT